MGNATNTSAHTSLKVKLYCNTSLEKRKQLRKPATQKILWDKGDINKYQQTVAQQIQTPTVLQQNVNDALTSITKVLSDSTKHAIPTKTINFHGPKYRLSNTTCWKKCVREVRDNNSRHVLQNPAG